MGYNTVYTLNLTHYAGPSDKLIISSLRNGSEGAKYALDAVGGVREACKWYEHEKDMARFSKKYPVIVFELQGMGDDPRDQWKKYFKNGLVQECPAMVAYAPYDEHLLKEPD